MDPAERVPVVVVAAATLAAATAVGLALSVALVLAPEGPALAEAAKSGVRDPHALSQIVRRTIGRWVNQSLRRRPMIVPLVIEA